jgi:murein DD-endopeptidase MepM/ murein hydrolase activator NlpD
MRRLVVLLLVAAFAVLLFTRAEPFGPQVTVETPLERVGRAALLRVVAHDRGSGLSEVTVRLVPQNGSPAVIATQTFPRASWLGSGVHEKEISTNVDALVAGAPEGPATIEIWAHDHSWVDVLRRGPRATLPVTVDLTPPTVAVLTQQHVIRLGGAECLVYRVSDDAVRSGVEVRGDLFPGMPGFFADPTLRVALFALPYDAVLARPVVIAQDSVGNQASAPIDLDIRKRTFAEKTLTLSDEFLAAKVPELLQANGLPPARDLVEGYLRVNGELRKATELKLRQICRGDTPTALWQGGFLRLPNSAPLSGFADHRSYLYKDKVIDQQTHLGFDLASLRGSPIPAANNGRVVFSGPLGIYGNTVIIDHGLGLFTLYGHLSEMTVAVGATVARGDTIGKTGDTGLAGGDHLHFSTMVRGVHVDPVEWWDAHWIQDHVELRLNAFPRSAGAGR